MRRPGKRIWAAVLAALCMLCLSVPAAASSGQSTKEWNVVFTKDTKMEDDFNKTSGGIVDAIRGMEPGDSTTFSIRVRNENALTTDWYMTNQVLNSLEDDSVATGGAYTYKLTYTDKAGRVTSLFDSEAVGGEKDNVNSNRVTSDEGLHQATINLEEYFYLDTLKTGDSGVVRLEVALDGETQDNMYMGTLADLEINFAVETDTSTTSRNQVVKTGDETNLLPLYAAMAASGVLLLVLACFTLKRDRRERGRGQRHGK